MKQKDINPGDRPNPRPEPGGPMPLSPDEPQSLSFLGKFLTSKEIAEHLATSQASAPIPPQPRRSTRSRPESRRRGPTT
jgi:hypothetical protein